MDKSFTGRKRIRKSFGRISEVAPLPNLIEVQKNSYDKFLQTGIPQEQRTDSGLQEVFKSVFRLKTFRNARLSNSFPMSLSSRNTIPKSVASVA